MKTIVQNSKFEVGHPSKWDEFHIEFYKKNPYDVSVEKKNSFW